MTEKDLAKAIVKNALNFHSPDSEYPPSLVIDKKDYSDFDTAKLSEELDEFGFKLIDGRDAPPPFSEMDEDFKSRKWYIYQYDVDEN